MAAHRSIRAADLDPEDELAVRTVLGLAVAIDQLLKPIGGTLEGMKDNDYSKIAYNFSRLAAELGRAMDRALLTPQSRIAILETVTVDDPFVQAMSNVRNITGS
jgi:hypothetical protein